jgi:hypothetical protein
MYKTMNKSMNKTISIIIPLLLLFTIIFVQPAVHVQADTATAVSVGTIDYEKLTMQIYYNNNSLIYYSTDKSTWEIADGEYDSTTKSLCMDISWVSASSEVIIYLKGDVATTVKAVTLPSQNSSFTVSFDKVEGEFTFDGTDDADTFEWRKSTDYYWNTVSLNESSASYIKFLATMEYFRVKGASIVIRLPQEKGTGISNVGTRSSAEKAISVTARGTAPTVKVNASKLTLTTTSAMEYYDSASSVWISCDGALSLEEIAPKTLYGNGAKTVTLLIRKAATTTSPYSKTQFLTIKGQAAAPVIGDSLDDVAYYYLNSKLVMQFNNASTTNIYEYTVVKAGADFDLASASWKSVTSTKLLTLSSSTAPDGCSIYIRKKGTDANTSTNIELVLSSAISSFTVDY